jgi:PhzF family phenazine biosynthesis protein
MYVVHAFAERPFAGNPAAVCFPASQPADQWMQQVAAEMRLSETAFLTPEDGGYRLRWFTPAAEVKLCGHATLASAHVLWESGRLRAGAEARFHTRSGLLTVNQYSEGMTMDFPACTAEPCQEWNDLPGALGSRANFVGKNGMDALVELENDRAVRALKPDIELLSKYPFRGLIVTARSDDSRYDFVSRFFAPRVGVPEDPVTGSAHCCLGPYWSERLGKRDLVGHQVSERGGIVRVGVRGNRVQLGGRAVTVMSGEWHASTLA